LVSMVNRKRCLTMMPERYNTELKSELGKRFEEFKAKLLRYLIFKFRQNGVRLCEAEQRALDILQILFYKLLKKSNRADRKEYLSQIRNYGYWKKAAFRTFCSELKKEKASGIRSLKFINKTLRERTSAFSGSEQQRNDEKDLYSASLFRRINEREERLSLLNSRHLSEVERRIGTCKLNGMNDMETMNELSLPRREYEKHRKSSEKILKQLWEDLRSFDN